MKQKTVANFTEEKIENFCRDLEELVTEIINCKEKEMTTLTYKEIKFYEKQKICHICKKYFFTDENNEKEFKCYHIFRDHCNYTLKFRGAA